MVHVVRPWTPPRPASPVVAAVSSHPSHLSTHSPTAVPWRCIAAVVPNRRRRQAPWHLDAIRTVHHVAERGPSERTHHLRLPFPENRLSSRPRRGFTSHATPPPHYATSCLLLLLLLLRWTVCIVQTLLHVSARAPLLRRRSSPRLDPWGRGEDGLQTVATPLLQVPSVRGVLLLLRRGRRGKGGGGGGGGGGRGGSGGGGGGIGGVARRSRLPFEACAARLGGTAVGAALQQRPKVLLEPARVRLGAGRRSGSGTGAGAAAARVDPGGFARSLVVKVRAASRRVDDLQPGGLGGRWRWWRAGRRRGWR